MLDAIKRFFEQNLSPRLRESAQDEDRRLRLATAALLIQVMTVDDRIEEDEQRAVARSLRSKFRLTDQETAALVAVAREAASQATSDYEFTSLLKQGFNMEQRVKVVEHLWHVAFADGNLDKHEEHLVRRIADLLYVPHSEFIRTKLKVKRETAMPRGGGA